MNALYRICLAGLAVLALAGGCARGQGADGPGALLSPAGGAGPERHRIEVGVSSREYLVVDPRRTGPAPAPLLIALHGGGGNAQEMLRITGLAQAAGREGFVLVLPEGLGRRDGAGTWNAGGCCAYAARNDVHDVAFVTAVIDEMVSRRDIDASRVYLVGASNGGMLTHRVGVAIPDRLAAIGVVVGAMFGGEPVAGSPLPVMMINGRDDDVVPVAGGMSPNRIVRRVQDRPFQPSDYAFGYWRNANRCRGRVTDQTAGGVHTRRIAGCAQNAEVVLIEIAGAGHGWPGGRPGRHAGEPPTQAIDATQTLWNFLSAHRREGATP